MEELAQLRQLLVAGNTQDAIALIDELEEMSKKAIIRNIEWVRADIFTSEGIKLVADTISESVLDAVLFMGGVWKKGAFGSVVRVLKKLNFSSKL